MFCTIMDLKVAFVIVCLCAVAITFTEAGIPKCCISTKRHIPKKVLMKVHKWQMQRSNGACDIEALVLYVKGLSRPICANPKEKAELSKVKQRMKRSKEKRRL